MSSGNPVSLPTTGNRVIIDQSDVRGCVCGYGLVSFARDLMVVGRAYSNGTALWHGTSRSGGCRFINIHVMLPSDGCRDLMK